MLMNLSSYTHYLFVNGIKKKIIPALKKDFLTIILILISLVMVASLYLTALQPPYAYDELAYHFPEALQIVDSGRAVLNFGGHYFYGNIPKLMEVLFALGITTSGFPMAHLLNFTFFIGGLISA